MVSSRRELVRAAVAGARRRACHLPDSHPALLAALPECWCPCSCGPHELEEIKVLNVVPPDQDRRPARQRHPILVQEKRAGLRIHLDRLDEVQILLLGVAGGVRARAVSLRGERAPEPGPALQTQADPATRSCTEQMIPGSRCRVRTRTSSPTVDGSASHDQRRFRAGSAQRHMRAEPARGSAVPSPSQAARIVRSRPRSDT